MAPTVGLALPVDKSVSPFDAWITFPTGTRVISAYSTSSPRTNVLRVNVPLDQEESLEYVAHALISAGFKADLSSRVSVQGPGAAKTYGLSGLSLYVITDPGYGAGGTYVTLRLAYP